MIRFSTGASNGDKQHEAQLFFDDASSPTGQRSVSVTLKARIEPDLVVLPKRIDLGMVSPEHPVTATIEIERVGLKSPLVVSNLRTSSESLSVAEADSHGSSGAGDRAVLEVTFDAARYPRELLSAEVTIATNSKAMSRLSVPVIARIERAFRVAPDSAFFVALPEGPEVLERELELTFRSPISADQIDVESDISALTMRKHGGESASKLVKLSLALDASQFRGSRVGRLRIRANASDNLDIPVRFLDLRETTPREVSK